MKPVFFASGREFRSWLATHHDRESELLLGFYKKGAKKRGITYAEALDEALAYGWIDGVRKNLDADRWTIRFTPRKARSIWSNVNIAHVARLMKAGRMARPGMRAFEARSPERSGIYSFEKPAMTFDAAIDKAFAAKKRARAFFDAQPPGYRKVVTHWVMSAKKEETRFRRLERLIEKSGRRERIDFMKPNQ